MKAFGEYVKEVKNKEFPKKEHTYKFTGDIDELNEMFSKYK